MGADTAAKVKRHAIDPKAIAQWVAEAEQAGRHRVFYDAHKDAPRGFGVRITQGGAVSFVLNYYAHGSERRATVNKPGERLSITAARKRAQTMRDKINAGGDPLAEKQAARDAKKAAKAEAVRKADYGFGALMAAYVAHLKADSKTSWPQVEGAIARHITEPFPKLAAKPADEVTKDDVMPVFHRLTKTDKFPEARKLRVYLRAAYTAAKRARNDAAMFAFSGFRIQSNPLADFDVTRPKESAEKAAKAAKERKWALSEAQLAEPIPEMRYAFGAIYEQFGATKAAIAAYEKVEKPTGPINPVDTWILAQQHLKALEADQKAAGKSGTSPAPPEAPGTITGSR